MSRPQVVLLSWYSEVSYYPRQGRVESLTTGSLRGRSTAMLGKPMVVHRLNVQSGHSKLHPPSFWDAQLAA